MALWIREVGLGLASLWIQEVGKDKNVKMDKQKADHIITEYLPKIYGFAIKKAFSYDEAEDLCADIIQETYLSLLKAEAIGNLEGYIWRLSMHVYARYVAVKKRNQGISIDGMEIPYYEDYDSLLESVADDTARLRREIAFLTKKRREIVYLFYYEGRTISYISQKLNMPEGTVKWHLNKARNELKEGFSMERKIGTLGMSPVKAVGLDHDGDPGPSNQATEFYLKDRLDLNIVYSVYHEPKTLEEIAVELGITPVFLAEKVEFLEENGFLVQKPGGKFTTYVKFFPRTYSREEHDQERKVQLEAAKLLLKEYVPAVQESVKDVEAYIPTGNKELLEAAAIFYGISCKNGIGIQKDLSQYFIKTTAGGSFIAMVWLETVPSDPEYQLQYNYNYNVNGPMYRCSGKYPAVSSWSVDMKYSSREGAWRNNLTSDYDLLYGWMNGMLEENAATVEQFKRLKTRGYLTEDNQVNIMVVKGGQNEFFARIPSFDDAMKKRFANQALEIAMMKAKNYPPQMQALVISQESCSLISYTTAMMVLDYLYEGGTFQPLTEREKITSGLLMFSDILPSR